MDKIEDVRFTECVDSKYVRPSRMHYKQNGKDKMWDLLWRHDAVAAVIYNTTRNVLIFVRQFRPAIYWSRLPREVVAHGLPVDTKKYPPGLGMTLELCAGLMDKKGLTPAQAMQEEILEECGYKVPLDNIKEVTSFRGSVGVSGNRLQLFYAEVTDAMRDPSYAGGCLAEDEMVEVVEMTIPEARRMILDESIMRPPACLFGTLWFLEMRKETKE